MSEVLWERLRGTWNYNPGTHMEEHKWSSRSRSSPSPCTAVFALLAAAQECPTKALRFIAPNLPGGPTDILGRLIGQKLSESPGQPVIIENRAGAGEISKWPKVVKSIGCSSTDMNNIKVLSAGAVKTGVAQLAQSYSREHDTGVKVEFTTAPGVRDRMAAGEEADVVIAPPAFIDELERVGKIVPDTRRFLGRARMGVVVHEDAPLRDIPDVETLKRTLTSASAVVHNKASSGAYAAKLLQKLGIAGELELRVIVVDSGSAVMEYVAAHGPGTVGLAQISEIRVLIAKGCRVRLAAPLPDAVQNVTSYEAAVIAGGSQETAARDLAAYLANPAAKNVFAATGID